jgi:hypothetical protein
MTLTKAFEVCSVLLATLAAIRMQQTGLHRRYRFLFAYLVFLAPFSFWPIVLNIRSVLYFRLWIATEPMNWVFEILVVRELCGLVLERYKGLCSLGRWAMYAGMGISAAVSFASLLPRIASAMPERSRILFYTMGAGRGVNFALAIFLLLMMILGSRYPVPLSRNVVLNAVIFTLLFLSNTFAALVHTLFDRRTSPLVDCCLMAIGAASLAVWLFYLTPEGETAQVEIAHLRPEHEERLLARLDDLNALVLRVAEF